MDPQDTSQDRFFPKFSITRTDTGEIVDPNTTFTLIPEHDKYAVHAIEAYVNACRDDMPGLAEDLTNKFLHPTA